jgi:hypothetical protein
MKIKIEHEQYINVYECVEKQFRRWIEDHADLLRLSDLTEDFIRASPILQMAIEEVCAKYSVNPKINNYNVGLITGLCSTQFDVFVTTYAWHRPMRALIEKENQ